MSNKRTNHQVGHSHELEPLEMRRMLSASLKTSGVLVITGTERPDQITVAAKENRITVQINGTRKAFSAARVRKIRIDGKGGDDVLTNSTTRLATMLGGNGNDTINGGSRPEVIDGGAGNDSIMANQGNDSIDGGDGNDVIDAGAGNDTIRGSGGNDALSGGDGDDRILGGTGLDTLSGGNGNDWLIGGDDADSLRGGAGDDTLQGEAGDDYIAASDGNDQLFGGVGNDVLFGEYGDDQLNGDAGDDSLNGGDGSDVVLGGDGTDALLGEVGDDTLVGGIGADRMYGDAGNDIMNGGDTSLPQTNELDLGDLLEGGEGADTLVGNRGNDTLSGGNGNDALAGGAGDDIMSDGAGEDAVDGGSGNDVIEGTLDRASEVLNWTVDKLKDLGGKVWEIGEYIFDRVSSAFWSWGQKLLGWIPGFTRHPTVPGLNVGGQVLYALEIEPQGGSRSTFNFSVSHPGMYQCFVINVSDADRAAMRFQRKGDKRFWEDSNRGPVFGHGNVVPLDGNGNYLAERGFSAEYVRARNPRAAVMFVPQGMDLRSLLLKV